jgi:hypothetical protein
MWSNGAFYDVEFGFWDGVEVMDFMRERVEYEHARQAPTRR